MYFVTGLENFEITKETCFICGRPADTVEHLFPKWLQHKFNLWDEKLVIPNKTTIAYRQLLIPCCKKCNNEVYSGLETRIAAGTETEADIWRWANKLHFGLSLKDKFFDWDRKNPGYKIGDVLSPYDPLEQSRHFLHCVSGDFTCDPDPFGSVFKFTFTEPQEYTFVHITNSSSICISLGDRGYIVFVRDGQFLKKNRGVLEDFQAINRKDKIGLSDMLFFYAKNIEFMERFHITLQILVMEKKIVMMGRPTIRDEKPVNKELLRAACKYMGITWIDPEEIDDSPRL